MERDEKDDKDVGKLVKLESEVCIGMVDASLKGEADG